MPIYEFYCPDCHTIFSFLSARVDTTTVPKCPKCARAALERQVSRFAISRGLPDPSTARPGGGSDEPPSPQEEQMMRAMESLASDAESLDENDPRQMAGFLRRLYGSADLPVGPAMEEAMRRMEAGEDPDVIDEELGDRLESEMPFGDDESPLTKEGRMKWKSRRRPPLRDETLYSL
ncbi:MAG: zinc ribbon domain-containing protein [Acidobacteria bacterium]|nr:zinc ribbon domain-containing protein [Acidobacteriota bacterium]